MLPAHARRRHPLIEQRILDLSVFAEDLLFNRVELRDRTLGIIAAGVAYQYAREVFPQASVLKLGMVYPLPREMIVAFSRAVERVVVLEELDPFIEEQVRLMGVDVYGASEADYPATKSVWPVCGELNPAVVRRHAMEAGLLARQVAGVQADGPEEDDEPLPLRPPVLCPGCPHRSTFYVLHKLGLPVNGDIGCYTLGMVPPLEALDTCGCMGASIGVAHGASVAGDGERHVAVIGDSTFFHTGIPALINVAYNHSDVITIILDNRTTGMTGHQENPGTGRTLQGEETARVDIEALVRAIGIDRVVTVDAYDVDAIERRLKGWLEESGPCVLIAQRACALLRPAREAWMPLEVDHDRCNGCKTCFRIGCPAILASDEMDARFNRPLAEIDPLLCVGCEICAQVCPRGAILTREQVLARAETAEAPA
jgi:indolepyruvate ferredoxin oxidoreductase alpha subunit